MRTQFYPLFWLYLYYHWYWLVLLLLLIQMNFRSWDLLDFLSWWWQWSIASPQTSWLWCPLQPPKIGSNDVHLFIWLFSGCNHSWNNYVNILILFFMMNRMKRISPLIMIIRCRIIFFFRSNPSMRFRSTHFAPFLSFFSLTTIIIIMIMIVIIILWPHLFFSSALFIHKL